MQISCLSHHRRDINPIKTTHIQNTHEPLTDVTRAANALASIECSTRAEFIVNAQRAAALGDRLDNVDGRVTLLHYTLCSTIAIYRLRAVGMQLPSSVLVVQVRVFFFWGQECFSKMDGRTR